MNLLLARLSDDGSSTIGMLYVNGEPECFMLEDEFREDKLKHETRIPSGVYEISLRTVGSTHAKYASHRDTEIRNSHKGMLWLRDVPNFEYILIHIGNDDDDTSGCLLPGVECRHNRYGEGKVLRSTEAYKALYPEIAKAIQSGELVTISILDVDRMVGINRTP